MTLRVGTSIEKVVIVEDASEDEEADSAVHTIFEDPVDLIIAMDGFTQFAVEVEVELPDVSSMEATPPMNVTVMKFEKLQVVTPTEDVVLVEDASDDEEDPATIASVDGPTLILVEAKLEEPPDDLLLEALPPPDDTILPLSLRTPPSTITPRRKRKSYDKSSLRRSAHLAQRNILRNLGIIGNDGKFDEDAIQGYANYLKEVLPLDLLGSLMYAKGHAF
ncbi:hypothetical protein BAE44_0002056 [Dichanthelium oligosanthes]|uniref:Uncharacterized protein n=1 Tax=Dichanthelium oligosanthes TaxID=888268 RepID=A0A1E5WHS8_9POAL|nr:hypothetical protein BAE44_0002056 [Dichanthelium oligosanthes]